MSASSLCVTCGTLSHERCRNGPDTFLIRGSFWVSTGPNLRVVLRRDLRDTRTLPKTRHASGRGRGRGLGRPLEEAEQVVLGDPALRPGRGDPGQIDTQLAGHPPHTRPGMRPGRGLVGRRPVPPATDGGAANGAPTVSATGCAAAGPAAGSCCSTNVGGSVLAPSPEASIRIGVPSLTSSPTLTNTSPTVPDAGAGTSRVALSDSNVSSGSSALTLSPVDTWTSMIGTALKSPMSGTRTSVGVDMGLPLRPVEGVRAAVGVRSLCRIGARRDQARAGSSLSGSMP